MSSNFEFIDDGFIARFSGRVSLNDILSVNIALNAHPAFNQHQFQLFDFSDATIVPNNEAEEELENHAIADYGFSIRKRKVKVATVATDPEIIRLADIYQTDSKKLGNSWLFQIFDNFDEALTWVKASTD